MTLCLASFTEARFEVHPQCSTCFQSFLCLNDILIYVYTTIYPFIHWWRFRLFPASFFLPTTINYRHFLRFIHINGPYSFSFLNRYFKDNPWQHMNTYSTCVHILVCTSKTENTFLSNYNAIITTSF